MPLYVGRYTEQEPEPLELEPETEDLGREFLDFTDQAYEDMMERRTWPDNADAFLERMQPESDTDYLLRTGKRRVA